MMWKMKSCPKCNGDLYLDYDEDGMFNHCLQCGYAGNIDPGCLITDKPETGRQPAMASK
ncbi:MAG: hypothetical protein RBS96_04180 [Dehalococcoidales bacterium]|jgi:DNA-directed RNA polymerase subunit M/transcription elongation factor TFIIS|nr:hypothetical protein [Dehalococcoidales bacterium]